MVMRKASKRLEKPVTKRGDSRTSLHAVPEPAAGQALAGGDAAVQSGLYDKAIGLFRSGAFAQAKEVFDKAATGPTLEIAHSARAHSRMCEQRMERAVAPLHGAEDYYNYGVALLNRGELETAGKHLEKAVALSPGQDHYHYTLALCCGLRRDLQQAYAHLKRAIELQPRNRAHARNDPDFASFVRQQPLVGLLFPDGPNPA